MFGFIANRLALALPTLLGVSLVVFFSVRLSPGDPAQLYLGAMATQTSLEQLRQQLGLDQPVVYQYLLWLKQIVVGDWGQSITYRTDVLGLVGDRLGASIILGAASFAIAVPVGLLLGVLAALYRNTIIDIIAMTVAIAGISLPVFWVGLLFIVQFSLNWQWFPSSGMYSLYGDRGLGDLLRHLVLPATSLALVPLAVIARITRSSMLEVLSQDYIRTARAKGLRPVGVVMKHTLKNALTPVLTVLGLQVGYLIGGAVLIENIYAWPGIGQLLLDAITSRDFPVVVGGSLLLAVVFIVANLITDLSYGLVDPRIRYG
jgi:peptide/nickel transport system permease protein